ncbi:MAG: cbb3-type cytochrome c oxidase subunit I [Caldilineaceae bacterium]
MGTVQGVLQVLPANADWIHYAGKFGQYVDPISHAHINLVTGMMVALAGFFVYFSPQFGGRAVGQRQANRLFWTLVPGSLLFYLTFLGLGLVLGNAVNGYGGLYLPEILPFLSQRRALLLAVSGAAMLAGFWLYFATLWRTLDLRTLFQRARRSEPAAFWLASTVALVIGTTHGLLQVIPATALYLTTPEELPNIHAQLNMVGGVLLALIGLVYLLLPQLVGERVDKRLARLSLLGISSGIAGYYVVTVAAGLARYGYMRQGLDTVQSAARLGWVAPALLTITSVPMLIGYGAFALAVFRATHAYRQAMMAEWRLAPARFSGPMPARLRRIPVFQVLGMEFVGGCVGWPGLGWLYAGQALPGVALLLIGPAIAWALLPMLFSPFTETALCTMGLGGAACVAARFQPVERSAAGALHPAQSARRAQCPCRRTTESRPQPVLATKVAMPATVPATVPMLQSVAKRRPAFARHAVRRAADPGCPRQHSADAAADGHP